MLMSREDQNSGPSGLRPDMLMSREDQNSGPSGLRPVMLMSTEDQKSVSSALRLVMLMSKEDQKSVSSALRLVMLMSKEDQNSGPACVRTRNRLVCGLGMFIRGAAKNSGSWFVKKIGKTPLVWFSVLFWLRGLTGENLLVYT